MRISENISFSWGVVVVLVGTMVGLAHTGWVTSTNAQEIAVLKEQKDATRQAFEEVRTRLTVIETKLDRALKQGDE